MAVLDLGKKVTAPCFFQFECTSNVFLIIDCRITSAFPAVALHLCVGYFSYSILYTCVYYMKNKNIVENINQQWLFQLIVLSVASFSFSQTPTHTHTLHLASVSSAVFPPQSSFTPHVCHSVFLSVCVTPLLPARIVGKHCRRNHLLLAYLFLNPLCCKPFDLTVALVAPSVTELSTVSLHLAYMAVFSSWLFLLYF